MFLNTTYHIFIVLVLSLIHTEAQILAKSNLRGSKVKGDLSSHLPGSVNSKGFVATPGTTTVFAPTSFPTFAPTTEPTTPTIEPSNVPTFEPSNAPTFEPSNAPTVEPSFEPSVAPTTAPSFEPSAAPTTAPSFAPSAAPTTAPSFAPSAAPTSAPSFAPSAAPTTAPSFQPTIVPTSGCLGNNIWDFQKKLGAGLPSYNFQPNIAGEINLTVGAYTGNGIAGANPDSTLQYHANGLADYLEINGYLQFDVTRVRGNAKNITFFFGGPATGSITVYETDNYGGGIPIDPSYQGAVPLAGYTISGAKRYVKVRSTTKCFVDYVKQVCK